MKKIPKFFQLEKGSVVEYVGGLNISLKNQRLHCVSNTFTKVYFIGLNGRHITWELYHLDSLWEFEKDFKIVENHG